MLASILKPRNNQFRILNKLTEENNIITQFMFLDTLLSREEESPQNLLFLKLTLPTRSVTQSLD